MFTPYQRRAWPGGVGDASRTEPHPQKTSSWSNSSSKLKVKSVAFVEPFIPASNGVVHNNDNSLEEKVSELQQELFEYQYNMGLLLIEKKEWSAKYEELEKIYEETNEILKQERNAHLIAITDVEDREDNLRKSLGVEKQCVLDLENAVRELRSEIAEIKFTADSKLAEANALVSGVEEKSLEVESKLRAIDAKLAEINRKSSEIERKTQDIQQQESNLRRECLSFIAEKDTREAMFEKQRENLREWEKRLQEGEERISKGQQIIIQREERAAEKDKMFKQKEKELEDTQRKIDKENSIMKTKEDDIISRVASLQKKEIELKDRLRKQDIKAEELHALEISLQEREQIFMQKLIEEHNAILDAKKHDLELEMEQKRLCLEDEFKRKINILEKKEVEVNIMEEKLTKKEQTLDTRLKNLKEKEKDFESKLKDLKLREKNVKSDEKTIKNELEKIQSEKEAVLNHKNDLKKIVIANEELLQKIRKEEEVLQLSQKERSEFVGQQSELKKEIEKCRSQHDLLLKEAEDLKRQRENFEKEWEELDEKKEIVNRELKIFREQQTDVDKLRIIEEERLKLERKTFEDYMKSEMESLRITKESFEAEMAHERGVLAEKAHIDRSHMLHEIEQLRVQQDNELEKKKEQLEIALIQKERLFEEDKEKELKNLSLLKDVAKREMEDIDVGRRKLEREKREIDENKKYLHEQQHEIQVDISNLDDLSKKIRKHREEFVKEKERFLMFVENHKNCNHCSEITSEYVLSDLISSQEIDNANISLSPRLEIKLAAVDDIIHDPSGDPATQGSPSVVRTLSPVSWIKKCTSRIFKLSPGKKAVECSSPQKMTDDQPHLDEEPSKINLPTQGNLEKLLSDASTREEKEVVSESINDQSNKFVESQMNSCNDVNHPIPSPRKAARRVSKSRKKNSAPAVDKCHHDELNKLEDDDTNRRYNKKRDRSVNEHIGSDQSDSITAGATKKRRQKVADAKPRVESHYYLRRPKLVTSAVGIKNSKTSVDGGGAIPLASSGFISQNGGSSHLIPCKKMENSVAKSDEKSLNTTALREECKKTNNSIAESDEKSLNVTALSEEVNGSPEPAGTGEMYDESSPSRREGDDSDDEENEEESGEASIGKKLWTFFTT